MNDNRLKLIFVFLIKLIKLGLASFIYCTDFESEFYFELRTIFSLSLTRILLWLKITLSHSLNKTLISLSHSQPDMSTPFSLSLSLSFIYLVGKASRCSFKFGLTEGAKQVVDILTKWLRGFD